MTRVALGVGAVLLAVCVLWPGLIATHDPLATSAADALRPPSVAHWLGTDQVGRDIYSRIVHGAASTVGAGLAATALAVVLGAGAGLLSAFGPAWERAAALRLTEAALAFPEFLLALLILAFLGPGVGSATLAVALAAAPSYARVAALSARRVITSDAVVTARVLGVSRPRVALRHVLPEAVRPVLALAVVGAAAAMLAIAGLTFLGLGVQPPHPDWGAMLAQGKSVVQRGWWTVVFPGAALALTAAGFTLAARAVRGGGAP